MATARQSFYEGGKIYPVSSEGGWRDPTSSKGGKSKPTNSKGVTISTKIHIPEETQYYTNNNDSTVNFTV